MENQTKRWLERVLPVIEECEGVCIEALEKCKTLNIDSKEEECYSAVLTKEDIAEEVFLFVCQAENRIILFRNFVLEEDCDQYPEDVELIQGEGADIMTWNETKKWILFDQVVVAKQYRFDESARLVEDQTGLRNDRTGTAFKGKLGKYFIRVGNQYID